MTLRALIKTVTAEALCRSGADRWLPPQLSGALVLGYHQVVPDSTAGAGCIPAMLVTTTTLERQLDAVGRRFRFVSLDELGAHLESGRPSDRPLAAVTFDDGYRDVYEHAFPLLRRKGIPAAVFVVTGLLGSARLQTHDRLYLALTRLLGRVDGAALLGQRLAGLGLQPPALRRIAAGDGPDAFAVMRALLDALAACDLERVLQALAAEDPSDADLLALRPLNWEMVVEMHRAGFTIGSHTCRHALLTHEGPDRVREEVSASRQELEARLGAPVRHFAYPDGRFSPAVVDAVASAGYRFAYTTCGHRDPRRPLLTVPRRLLWENSWRDAGGRFSPAIMRCEVQGLFDLFGRCRQDHGSAAPHRQPTAA